MTRLVLAALAAAALAAPAHAHPAYHYTGSCVSFATNVGTSWTGPVAVSVTATDSAGNPALVPISVKCHLKINGAVWDVVAAGSGIGSAWGIGSAAYTADPDVDVVELCDEVVVGGEHHYACDPA